jgi:hypothetical protein
MPTALLWYIVIIDRRIIFQKYYPFKGNVTTNVAPSELGLL